MIDAELTNEDKSGLQTVRGLPKWPTESPLRANAFASVSVSPQLWSAKIQRRSRSIGHEGANMGCGETNARGLPRRSRRSAGDAPSSLIMLAVRSHLSRRQLIPFAHPKCSPFIRRVLSPLAFAGGRELCNIGRPPPDKTPRRALGNSTRRSKDGNNGFVGPQAQRS